MTPPADDPISKIEDDHASKNIGRLGYLIYKGAVEEGASESEAMFILNAWFSSVAAASSIENLFKDLGGEDDGS